MNDAIAPHEDGLPTTPAAPPAVPALDAVHAEAAVRELALAQRLSAGGVYFTARETGTRAVVLLCKALGLTEREIHTVEAFCIQADARTDDYSAAHDVCGECHELRMACLCPVPS